MTTTCHYCKQEHALQYWVTPNGKKTLTYVCDRVPRIGGGKGLQYVTMRLMADKFVDGLPIEELWSKGWADKQEKKAQFQLPLMTPRRNK